MDLWNSYKERALGDYAASALKLNTGERKYTSLKMVEEKARELEINTALFQHYDESRRYVTAKNLTYDLLLTVYDVNTRSTLAARITRELGKDDWVKLRSSIRKVENPNFELRVIGLQNNFVEPLAGLDVFYKELGCTLMEIDLFGNNVRHIAFDAKTGVPYDLLLANRLYRPGELVCQLSRDKFSSGEGQLVFV
ncbi:MAG: hypothetical protein ACYCO0_00735 [Candidatus Micrarchaeaceae archaeon]